MPRPRLLTPRYRLKINRAGRYEVVWTEDGRTRSVSTGTDDRAAAERFFDQWRAGLTAPVIQGPTMRSIVESYLSHRTDRASYGSMRAIANVVMPRFGNLEPRHITQALVQQHAQERLAAGKRNSTVVSDFLLLRSAVNWAIASKLLPPSERLAFEMPIPRSPPRDRWLTKEEAARLLDAAKAPHIRLFVLLALRTGARRDAILELEWSQVDFAGNRINYGAGTKTKKRTIVPLDDDLKIALLEARAVATTNRVIEYGGHSLRDIRTGLEAAARRAGIPHVHPHLFRHSAVSWAVQDGVPTARVARMFGMTEAMVERVYGKHSPTYLQDALAATRFMTRTDEAINAASPQKLSDAPQKSERKRRLRSVVRIDLS